MTTSLQVRPPALIAARWELPKDLAGLKGDALVDALWAVAVGNADALAEHRAAAAERSRHALADGLLIGARKKLLQAEIQIIDLMSDPATTVTDVEQAYATRQRLAEAVEGLTWRPNRANVKKPAADALALGIASRSSVRNWWAMVAAGADLFSEEQLLAGCARASRLLVPVLERAQEAGKVLARADAGDYTGSQERLKSARAAVEEVEAHLALARVHADIDHTEQGATR